MLRALDINGIFYQFWLMWSCCARKKNNYMNKSHLFELMWARLTVARFESCFFLLIFVYLCKDTWWMNISFEAPGLPKGWEGVDRRHHRLVSWDTTGHQYNIFLVTYICVVYCIWSYIVHIDILLYLLATVGSKSVSRTE